MFQYTLLQREVLFFYLSFPFAACGFLRQGAGEILFDHARGAGDQVGPVVGQVAVDALDESLVGKVAVGADGRFAHQEIADGIGAEMLEQDLRVEDVAARLGHFLFVLQPPAVDQFLLGRFEAGGHQERRPVDRVEFQDVFGHDVQVGRPETLEYPVFLQVVDSGEVIAQGVEPDIDGLVFVTRDRHTPLDRGAGDAQVLQPHFDERDHLVHPRFGDDEIRIFFIEFQQFFADRRKV